MWIINSYYSNLIEGHDTRPSNTEFALADRLETPIDLHRDFHLEAAAHVRVQAQIDVLAAAGTLPEPFYRNVPDAMLRIPGRFRTTPEDDTLR